MQSAVWKNGNFTLFPSNQIFSTSFSSAQYMSWFHEFFTKKSVGVNHLKVRLILYIFLNFIIQFDGKRFAMRPNLRNFHNVHTVSHWKIFRQINYLVIPLVKPLLSVSRDFGEERISATSIMCNNVHSVENEKFTAMQNFWPRDRFDRGNSINSVNLLHTFLICAHYVYNTTQYYLCT